MFRTLILLGAVVSLPSISPKVIDLDELYGDTSADS